MKLRYQRYRAYPNHERARSFDFLKSAKAFCAAAFIRQGISILDPIIVVQGSGSDFCTIGWYDSNGWHNAMISPRWSRVEERIAG